MNVVVGGPMRTQPYKNIDMRIWLYMYMALYGYLIWIKFDSCEYMVVVNFSWNKIILVYMIYKLVIFGQKNTTFSILCRMFIVNISLHSDNEQTRRAHVMARSVSTNRHGLFH